MSTALGFIEVTLGLPYSHPVSQAPGSFLWERVVMVPNRAV